MSGGHFNYAQHGITDIADEVERIIRNNSEVEGYQYSPETIAEFKRAIPLLRQAYLYVRHIDLLVCSDNSEESFHERLKEDLLQFALQIGNQTSIL